ncbi:hypothetical protein KBB96_14510 [Luteolibacter ambystomatis]|uniref:Uncharacterized protein n=1 Tax=Luteolibacter ambystomatis TaxID=2824561 RepID=A0A975G795_9BACT|nr:hypothetical protein [Luteolibacter ambystomatis]QUE50075.1 hypothetical protein KBB96_14510 [Luteolibacter ambystomatis]
MLWLTVPLAIWWGARVPAPGISGSRGSEAPPAPVRPLPTSEAFAAIERGLETADAVGLAARLQASLKLPPGMERDHAWELICARWAEVDPRGGLAFLSKAKEPYDPTLRVLLLKEWALADLDAAWTYLANHPTPEGEADVQWVADALLLEDPALFVQWVWRAPEQISGADAGNPAWLAVARTKPEELQAIAIKILASSPGSSTSSPKWNQTTATLFTLLGTARAERDSQAVFTWADTLPDPYRAQALKGALVTLARSSPAAALERLDALCKGKSNEWLRTAFHSFGDHDNVNGISVLTALGRDDPRVVAGLARKYPALESSSALVEVFGSALGTGKISALEAYRSLTAVDSDSGTITLNVLPRIWESLPPEQFGKTAAVLAKEAESEARAEAMGGLLQAWAKTSPDLALKFAGSLEDQDLRLAFYQKLIGTPWGTFSPANLASVPGRDRAAVIAASLEDPKQWGLSDDHFTMRPRIEDLGPEVAALPPSPEATDAAQRLMAIWSQTDPNAALAWANHFKDPAMRATCTADAIQGWARQDSNGAALWLDTQPPGQVRDAATLPLVRQLKESEPDVAWEWAGAISNETLRSQARREAFAAWATTDPDAAAAALDSAINLSEADLVALRQTLLPSP